MDLPWSMCAMMQKFRMNFGSMYLFLRARAEREAACPGYFQKFLDGSTDGLRRIAVLEQTV